MEWQPIEQGPKLTYRDSPTSVLVYGPTIGVREGRAMVVQDWVFADLPNVNGNLAGTVITHWMPLPSPPVPATPASSPTTADQR